jgi:nicotinamidase-related amidase
METVRGLDVADSLEDVADRSQLALIVYDMQAGIAGRLPGVTPVLGNIKRALTAARAAQLRVFFMRHTSLPVEVAGAGQLRAGRALQRAASYADVSASFLPGSPAHQIVPELSPLPSEGVLDKLGMSAFASSALDFALRDCGLQAFAIVGAVLELGIAPTVRHAIDLGYLPVVVGDACYTFEQNGATLTALARSCPVTDTSTFCATLGKS